MSESGTDRVFGQQVIIAEAYSLRIDQPSATTIRAFLEK
jgi:hypothetical protein